MKLATLSKRGTDIVAAGLKLSRRFTRADLAEEYGRARLARDGQLPQHWKQGISNELQRLGSGFSRFHQEGRRVDLITRVGSGKYCFRDEVRPKLIQAANERANLFTCQNVLVLPIEADDVAGEPTSHSIGVYAHQKIMALMQSRDYETKDTSTGRSYDFTFCGRNRFHSPQIMECKGTRLADGDFSVTPNEVTVMALNPTNYWLGVVYSIDITNGIASVGTAFITSPLVLAKWQFTKTFRLRRMPDAREQEIGQGRLL
jgi:hypothetical protein